MQTLLNHPDSSFRPPVEMKYSIDARGTVIFTLPSDGTVRDIGRAIYFSTLDSKAKIMARLLAQKRLEQTTKLPEHSFKASSTMESAGTPAKSGGLSR